MTRELLPIGAQPKVDGRARQIMRCHSAAAGIVPELIARIRAACGGAWLARRRPRPQSAAPCYIAAQTRSWTPACRSGCARRSSRNTRPATLPDNREARLEALCAPKQGACAVFGLAGKLGSAEIANHERVARQHKPRLVGTGPIGNEK